jgi:membrane-associated phospholipid phosphatase
MERLSNRASAIESQAALDPQSRLAYSLLFIWCLSWLAIFASSDFIASDISLCWSYGSACAIAGCGALARRYRHDRVALFLEACTVPAIAAALSAATIIMLASVSGRFVDVQLIRIDAMLGFDWRVIFDFYLAHPWIVPVSEAAYSSFQPQFLLLPVALGVWRPELLWTYMTAYIVALTATAAIFPFATAEGPYVYYGIPQGIVPSIGDKWPWQWHFGEWITQLQKGETRDISKVWGGLVQFPSFHSAAAVLFIWASRSIRFLGWPGLLINVAMIFSTFISGAHYLSDVLAGCTIGLLSIWAATKVPILQRLTPSRSPNLSPQYA